ncbi:hypothetical protein C8F04DRAFT_1356607 [Mycena alexandri]|uniref:Uncharacterized protein n=1 Tax=Mycena alexandri TaxID=1745969 RepID=A0AAD6TDM6_9AGAR|nr:hypothetical protein C8F04DRAFT_1356607 [Mycena alexandri]
MARPRRLLEPRRTSRRSSMVDVTELEQSELDPRPDGDASGQHGVDGASSRTAHAAAAHDPDSWDRILVPAAYLIHSSPQAPPLGRDTRFSAIQTPQAIRPHELSLPSSPRILWSFWNFGKTCPEIALSRILSAFNASTMGPRSSTQCSWVYLSGQSLSTDDSTPPARVSSSRVPTSPIHPRPVSALRWVREAQRLVARAVIIGGDPEISGYPDTLNNMCTVEDASDVTSDYTLIATSNTFHDGLCTLSLLLMRS